MTDDQSNYICNDDDLNSLTDYFTAALAGEESKSRLQQMWEQEIGIIKATHSAMADQCLCQICRCEKGDSSDGYCEQIKRRDAAIRNAILDELGILHGEDAKRFNEQLDHPEPLTPEARDLVMQAKRIASEKLPDRCRYWGKKEGKFVCAFLIPDPDLYEELTKRHDDEIINKLLDDLGAYLDAWRTQDPFIGIGMLKHYIQHYLRPITPNQGEENRDGD